MRDETIEKGWLIPSLTRRRPRWILAAAGNRVIYSTGSREHHECSIKTLKRWIRETKAAATVDEPLAPLELQ